MKKIILLLVFASIAHGQTVNDFQIPSRGNGGKVILAPKNANGVQVPVLSVDPVSGISGGGLSAKNYIINGDFDLFQRGVGPTTISSGANIFIADRFSTIHSGTGSPTIRGYQISGVPTLAQSGHQSLNGFAVDVNVTGTYDSANTSIISHDYKVEGSDYKQIHGKPVTLSFWVKSDSAANYCVTFRNSDSTRIYVSPYSVNQAATWEKKTISLTLDNTGTWQYGNLSGLEIRWIVAAGTNRQTSTVNQWQTNGGTPMDCNSSIRTNFITTSGAYLILSQVMLNEGIVPAPFQLAGGDIAGELTKAQRYYWRYDAPRGIFGYGNTTTAASYFVKLPVSMRGNPALDNTTTTGFAGTAEVAGSAGNSISAISIFTCSIDYCRLDATTTGLVAGAGTSIRLTAGFLGFTAEL